MEVEGEGGTSFYQENKIEKKKKRQWNGNEKDITTIPQEQRRVKIEKKRWAA